MQNGGLRGLSRAEIDALVGDVIRSEDASAAPRPTPAPPETTRPPSRWLRRAGALLSCVLVLCAAATLLRRTPHYSEHGLPTRPTTYHDGHYAFLLTQPSSPTQPIGFDPCSTIGVTVDEVGATTTIRADVAQVIATINRVSGLHLRYLAAGAATTPAAGNILVSFSEPGSDARLTTDMTGIGGIETLQESTATGLVYAGSGFVKLNPHRYNPSSHDSQLLTLTRQFGHAVGLANMTGRELMNSDQHLGVRHWAHGDLTGLARLGQLPCR